MVKYIKNPNTGKFAGSIGDGKNKIPTTSPTPHPSLLQRLGLKKIGAPTPTQKLTSLLETIAPKVDLSTEELEKWFTELTEKPYKYSDHVSPDNNFRYDLKPGIPQDETTIKALKRIGYEAYLSQKLPVFVYGTLRTGQGNSRLMAGAITDYTIATIKGIGIYNGEYHFPYAKEHKDPNAKIVGELTWLSDDHTGLKARMLLDHLEGFNADQPESSHYDRALKEVTITNAQGEQETHKAWIFLAQGYSKDQLNEKDRIPGGDWVKSGKRITPYNQHE